MPTPITVTATQVSNPGNGMLLRVMVLTGVAATQNGATAVQSANAAHNASITTTVTGSRVYGALTANDNLTFSPAVTGTTLLDNYADNTNGCEYGSCKTTAATGTPGATSVGATTPSDTGGIALLEVLPDGTIAEDPSCPAAVTDNTAQQVTTASFTPPAGALLVALVGSNGFGNVTTMAVSGGGVTWAPAAEANAADQHYAGVWTAVVPPDDPGDPVITATQGGATIAGLAMRIFVLTGAAAAQNGATASAAVTTGAIAASITTTQTGSRVYGAMTDSQASRTHTANGLTTALDNVLDAAAGETYCTFKAAALTGTPGATSLGYTDTITSFMANLAMAEILPSGTLTEDGSAPPPVSSLTQIFVSCANFTPPPGSLLVALVASNGSGTGTVTMTVSGGGLTWTEAVKNNPVNNPYAGVWTAQVPAAATPVPARPGRTWLRRFHHPQELPPPGGGPVTVDSTGSSPAGAGAVTAVATQAVIASAAAAGPVTAAATVIAGATAAGAGAVSDVATQIAGAASAGAGSVTDVATQIATTTAAGAGSVTAAGAVSGSSTASAAGAGSVTAVVTQIAPATAASAGAVAAAVTQIAPAAAAGAGAASAAATQAVTSAAAGAASVTDTVTQIAIASAAGAGSVTAAGSVTGAGATATAAGASAVTAFATQIAPAAGTGSGSVTDVATQAAKAAAAGAGSVTAAGQITGTANVAGAGTTTAKAAQAPTAQAAGAAVLSALAAQRATAALAAAGAATASGGVQVAFTVGTLTASDAPAAVLASAATAPRNTLTAATTTGGPS